MLLRKACVVAASDGPAARGSAETQHGATLCPGTLVTLASPHTARLSHGRPKLGGRPRGPPE